MSLRVYRAGKAVLLAMLAACLSAPTPAVIDGDGGVVDGAPGDGPPADAGCSDEDGDGYLAAGCAGADPQALDCVEGNAAVHPGAYDAPDNATDEDCLDGDATSGDTLAPMVSTTTVNGINFSNGSLQGRLGAAANYVIDELGSAIFGEPNLLYRGTGLERLVGVHVWDDYFMYATQTVPVPRDITEGRALLQVTVPWQAFAMAQVGMDGTTRYTMYPDGRIHLEHDFEVLQSSDNNFHTAYIALDHDAIDNVSWTTAGGGSATVGALSPPASVAVINPQNGEGAGFLCGYHATDRALVGFGYRVPTNLSPSGPRITENNDGTSEGHSIALQYDYTYSAPVPLGARSGDFLVYVGATGASPCAPAQGQIQPWLNPAAFSVTLPGAMVTSRAGDADNDGYVEGAGYYAVSAGGAASLELTLDTAGGTAAPSTSVYRIEGLDLTHDPTVYLDGTRLGHGDDYLLTVDGSAAWLYLGVPLANGSRLTVRRP